MFAFCCCWCCFCCCRLNNTEFTLTITRTASKVKISLDSIPYERFEANNSGEKPSRKTSGKNGGDVCYRFRSNTVALQYIFVEMLLSQQLTLLMPKSFVCSKLFVAAIGIFVGNVVGCCFRAPNYHR